MTPNHALLISREMLDYHAADRAAFPGQEEWDSWPAAYRAIHAYHAVTGFQVPVLPVAREGPSSPDQHLAQVLHRFLVFVRAMHHPAQRGAFALQVMAHPERSLFGAEVGLYLLCRVAAERQADAEQQARELGRRAYQLFPTEGLFNYGTPLWLSHEALETVTFQQTPDAAIGLVDLQKFEDLLPPGTAAERFVVAEKDYIPHCFWADRHLDPWLPLIEVLARQHQPVAVRVTLEPVPLMEYQQVSFLAQQYHLLGEEGTQRANLLDQAAQASSTPLEQRTFLQTLSRRRTFRAQGLTDYLITRAWRGAFVYQQLLAAQDHIFVMRVQLVASGGPVPEVPGALIQAVQAALASPTDGGAATNTHLGWMRPEAFRPDPGPERAYALQNLRWVGQTDWGDRKSKAAPKFRRLRYLVTPQEAVGLFHLPIMPQAGQTTALSTADVPFVIPPEVASTSRFQSHERKISAGYLYQRERCLNPQTVGDTAALPFYLRISDLEKPSLLVGAPGSGKSNLALYLLIQLWRDHQVPFLVLDPSTGHEYRYLYAEPSLRDDLVVYTLGDEDGFPFRFNPFEVPPGVTVRSHITRLLACFKAAYEMWDPLPAIYEAALARVYTGPPYSWPLNEKGGSGQTSPCLADFAQAVVDELEEQVLPDFGPGTEASGILTGSSKIRVQAILKGLGHILNVQHDRPAFFQTLLKYPAVIEMGALGDPSSIALVMAFLINQLAGHIEHAYPERKRQDTPHLLLIEEAHRLLSAEASSTTGINQGNTRGKSAEEMNMLLAEVRKFRQGVMVLDQRPSSLVGGVLDNALINMMCRLNDRSGFEHLSNVLNLNPAQQRYARTRLRPGETLMLDAKSGYPVLVRADNVVDALRERLEGEDVLAMMQGNAERLGLRPPEAESWQPQKYSTHAARLVAPGDEHDQFFKRMEEALNAQDWQRIDRQLRAWSTNKAHANRVKLILLQQTLDGSGYTPLQCQEMVEAFKQYLDGS